jgi:hypothetical protein
VRSTALTGVPSCFENCSARPPFEGVNFAFKATNPSAYELIADVKLENVEVDDAYVPGEMDESNWAKKGWERDVTWSEPVMDHVWRERYNCSATAKVARYHG